MKQFKPTYLYIKTHNDTGLKYFGKTTKDDPCAYKGSGKHWLAHIKKHGNKVMTEILGYYENKEDCMSAAELFSTENNIVESLEWANIIAENGLDGGHIEREYNPMSDETKQKLSEAMKGKEPWNKGIQGSTKGNTQPRSEETKQKLSESLKGKQRTQESIEKTAAALRGRKRPEASKWLSGRPVTEETRRKIAEGNRGKVLSEETKEKIRSARALQEFTEETKAKLKGMVPVVDKQGNTSKITKEEFYNQPNIGNDREYVFHNSKEGIRRKNQ